MAKATIVFEDTPNGPGVELSFEPHLEPEEFDKATNAQAIAMGAYTAIVNKMRKGR